MQAIILDDAWLELRRAERRTESLFPARSPLGPVCEFCGGKDYNRRLHKDKCILRRPTKDAREWHRDLLRKKEVQTLKEQCAN